MDLEEKKEHCKRYILAAIDSWNNLVVEDHKISPDWEMIGWEGDTLILNDLFKIEIKEL